MPHESSFVTARLLVSDAQHLVRLPLVVGESGGVRPTAHCCRLSPSSSWPKCSLGLEPFPT